MTYVLVLPGGLRAANKIAGLLFFTIFAALWLVFGALLIVNQGALDTIWGRLLDLPMVLQVIVWMLVLPLTVGLWIWESDLALWLRLALVIVLGVGWTAVMFPRPKNEHAQISDTAPGWHEVPQNTTDR